MSKTQTIRIAPVSVLNCYVLSRKTKPQKRGKDYYRTFYLSISKRDVETLRLDEGDRLTLYLTEVAKKSSIEEDV